MKRRVYATAADQPKDFEHLMNMYGLQYDGHHDGYSNSYPALTSKSPYMLYLPKNKFM